MPSRPAEIWEPAVSPEELAVVAAVGAVDEEWYAAQYADVADAGIPALIHYLLQGWKEGRDPGPGFSTDYYLAANPDVAASGMNPLVHYALHGWHEGRLPRADFVPQHRPGLEDFPQLTVELAGIAVQASVTDSAIESEAAPDQPPVVLPSLGERADVPASAPPAATALRTVAFYLPQFHPIPENDQWWGEGFTEWTNVVRATPSFAGHQQPSVPGELGYYDLRDPAVMRRQVELAVLHGISALCFYAYWFDGKRLLDRPLDAFLADESLELEFLVCWANENWTRTWDGKAQDILIGQNHSPEDDLAFIAEMAQYLRDGRYLRVDGKPVLLVYRPTLLPDPAATAARWRVWCRDNGIGEIILAYVQSFDRRDPAEFGFDVAVEFPPNNTGPHRLPELEAADGFEGQVYDWVELAGRSSDYAVPDYPLWRGVCPSWDNTARRGRAGAILWGANPDGFRQWMLNAGSDTISRFDPEMRLVFINAWNEWAEGACLEPDQAHGYQWLHAVRDAQCALAGAPLVSHAQGGVVLVTHDMHPHGAQMLALAMTRTLRRLGVHVEVVSLGDGELEADFAAAAPLHVLERDDDETAEALADRLVRRGLTTAICNTSVSGIFAALLSRAGADVTGLVHEMPSVLADPAVGRRAEALTQSAHRMCFPAEKVAADYPFHPPAGSTQVIRPQGVYQPIAGERSTSRREELRQQLGLPADATVALGVGFGDHRKGLDLFAEMAASNPTAADGSPLHFVWVGRHDTYDTRITAAVAVAGERLHLVGFVTDTVPYYQAADVLVLTSREDPFPSVVLEALMIGLPVVACRGRTGQDDLVLRAGGRLVEEFSWQEFVAEAIAAVEGDTPQAAEKRRSLIAGEFNFQRYVLDLLAPTPAALPRVSVVVPNYNYERFIGDRLDQILAQTYPVYELIVLDDASTDDSVAAIREALAGAAPQVRLVVNDHNSGSVFAQWRLGAQLATGDLVWIAEADDVADPSFLASLVPEFRAQGTVMAYSESRQIDADGAVMADHYRDYVADIDARDWTRRYRAAGSDEIEQCLAVRNTIPNVSAVLFDADVLREVLGHVDLSSLPTAGDWQVYLDVLQHGEIVFVPRPLNSHRRHRESVVATGLGRRHLAEIMTVQARVADAFSVPDEVRGLAVDYDERLFEQFGLGPASALHEDGELAGLVARIRPAATPPDGDDHPLASDATGTDKHGSG